MTVLTESRLVWIKTLESVQSETDTRPSENGSESETTPSKKVLETGTDVQDVSNDCRGKECVFMTRC